MDANIHNETTGTYVATMLAFTHAVATKDTPGGKIPPVGPG
jgi:hypothetical protein